MALDYTVCPHCGCHCEDDEYCAACGKLFHDEEVPTRNVSFLGFLRGGLRSQTNNFKLQAIEHDDTTFQEDPWSDPGWSTLRGNIFCKK